MSSIAPGPSPGLPSNVGQVNPDIALEAQLDAAGKKASGWWENFWAAYHASRRKGHGYFISVAAPLFNDSMAGVISFLTNLQGQDNTEFYTLTASVMSDLLGVEVSQDVMKQAFIKGGQTAGMQAVGAAFLKQLAGEFGSTLDFVEDKRLKPAQTFIGFLLSFAVRIGNLTFITGMFPAQEFIHPDDIREYGEQMAANLGLGRLARRALGPFIDDLVGKPMQDALRSQLRPTDLNVNEAILSFNRGLVDEVTFRKNMANLGYSDGLIDVLVSHYLGRLNPDEILSLLRWGTLSRDDAVGELEDLGYLEETASDLISSHDFQRADTAISDYLSTLREQLRVRHIDIDTFNKLVGDLPLPDIVKKWQRNLGAQIAETPSKRFSLTEMQRYYAEGFIDLEDFTTWAAADGYDETSTRILTLDLLSRTGFDADKLALEKVTLELKYRLLVRKAAKEGLPPPPPLTFP